MVPSNHFSTNALGRKRKENVDGEADDRYGRLNGTLVKRPRGLIAPVAGKVLKIELENFMCHSNLKLEFDIESNNCFYIIGANGSGKSALFAGLNIGLGGTGRTNERGKTIQHYIKEGQNYARIRIHLSNEGPNACPGFSDVIIVERNITEKTALFTLKTTEVGSAREKIVSKKKSDLDALVEQFNIELDNPLAWLSQDRSRQFLQQMKPEKLYQLYTKSSEMDSTDLLFQQIESHFDEFCRIFNSLDREKKARQENYEQMKARFKAAGEIREKKKERMRLLWYQLWAPIRDNNIKIDDLHARINEANKKKEEANSNDEGLKNDRDNLRLKQEQLVQQKEHHLEKNRKQNEQLTQLKQQSRNLKFEIDDAEQQVRLKENSKAGLDNEMRRTNEELKKLIGDSNRNIDEEKQSLEQELNKLGQRIETIEQKKGASSVEYQQAAKEHREQRKLWQDQTTELSQLDNQKKRLEEERMLYEKSKIDRLILFGKDTPHLVQLIKSNSHLFGKPPIGPIGSYIKLKDQKWANAVEFAIKKYFGTFICDSHNDRRALDELCRVKNIKTPEIITTAFTDRKFDIRAKEPPPDFMTIERSLEPLEPTIYNVLVDMMFVDSILLIENDEDARAIMRPMPPPNVTKAYTLMCSEVIASRGRQPYRFFADNSRFQSRVLAHQRFLAQDERTFAAKIKEIDQEMRQKEQETLRLDAIVKRMGRNASELNESVTELERQSNELNQKRFGLDEQLRKLDEILLSGEKIENIQGSLRETRQQRENTIKQLDKARADLAEKRAEQAAFEKSIDEANRKAAYLKNDVNQIETDIKNCGLQMEKIEKDLENVARDFDRFERLLGKYEDDLNELQENNVQREAGINEAQLAPEGETSPPDFEKIPPTPELERSLKGIERYIKTEENNHEPIPTKEDLKGKEYEYRKFLNGHNLWAQRKKKLEEMKDCRKKRFALLKASLPQKIESYFKEYMNIRGYRASLDVRDDKGLIEIRVETHERQRADGEEEARGGERHCRSRGSDGETPQNSRRAEKRVLQDLRGLSGGERSFTTISFVMALWSCMESPFRCSDEFDVFMDPVNRRIAMEMLGDLAKENKHIQFFFFTPQGIKELKDDEMQIQVFELKRIAGIFDGNEQQQQQENDEPMQDEE